MNTHPELQRAIYQLERATGSRLPALGAALASADNPALVRDLYTVVRQFDSLSGQVSRARRMGGVLIPGMRG
jgi:hypothetical protein